MYFFTVVVSNSLRTTLDLSEVRNTPGSLSPTRCSDIPAAIHSSQIWHLSCRGVTILYIIVTDLKSKTQPMSFREIGNRERPGYESYQEEVGNKVFLLFKVLQVGFGHIHYLLSTVVKISGYFYLTFQFFRQS